MKNWNTNDWNTKDLIELVFKFVAMVPNRNDWNEKSLIYNEPRLIRFKRIISLLHAFGIAQPNTEVASLNTSVNKTKNCIESFLSGDFILNREFIEYPNVKSLIENEVPLRFDKFNAYNVQSFYRHLMNYRMTIEETLQYNSSIMEASGLGVRASIRLTSELNKELLIKLEKIEIFLFEIINPENLNFDQDILINKFNFPKEDLFEIDIDNL